MNKGYLFEILSGKIKSHVVESQITLLVWPCLNHLQKIITQLITWSFLMRQLVIFASAALVAFARAYLCFLVSASSKKNAEVIKFLGILKKYVSNNKICFWSRKKSNISLNKNVIFYLSHNFQTWFHNADHLNIYRCLCSHFILFCSLISVSKKWNIEPILTFPSA